METNAIAHTAGVGFYLRTGARDEDPSTMGVSHFLEHMLFKGTARRTAEDINREFDDLGANFNAFTSHESTVFYAQVLPEFVPQATDLLTDMMQPRLHAEDFALEKKVILEEISMYEDRPAWRLQDALLETHFHGHPLAHRVLGTTQGITALTLDQLRNYHQQQYRPNNMFFVAAGRFDPDDLIAQLDRLTRHWRQGAASRRYDVPGFTPSERKLHDAKLHRHYLMLAMPAPCAQDEDRFAMRVLADLLGDAEGSRIYWALVDPGMADEASLSYEPQDRAGLCMAFASCDPQRAMEVEATLQTIFFELTEHAHTISEDELVRVKNKLATQATLAGEQPMGRMSSLGTSWLYLNRYVPLEEELAHIVSVSTEDIQRVLERRPLTSWTKVSLGPEPSDHAKESAVLP